MFNKNKKAQVAVLDLFVAAIIFGILVTILMTTWNEYNAKIDKQLEYNDFVIKVYHITDLLVLYHGKPSAWEKPSPTYHVDAPWPMDMIGLALEDGVISEKKLNTFLNMTYNETREIFNIRGYDYLFQLKRIDGSEFSPQIIKGVSGEEAIVAVRRLVLYNDEEAILYFQLGR